MPKSDRRIVIVVLVPVPPKKVEPPAAPKPRVRVTPVSWRNGVVRIETLDAEYPSGTGSVVFAEEYVSD